MLAIGRSRVGDCLVIRGRCEFLQLLTWPMHMTKIKLYMLKFLNYVSEGTRANLVVGHM